jgi:hypothetical protein
METKTPKKRGRKPINIDPDRVEHLASQGLGVMDICRSLGVGWDTFNKYREKKNSGISDALDRGKSKGLAFVTSKLMETIEDKNFNAISFYLRNRAPDQWADRQEINYNLDLKNVLTDARARIIDYRPSPARTLPKRAQAMSKNAQRGSEGEGANE